MLKDMDYEMATVMIQGLCNPRAPCSPNSRLLGCVTIGYIELRTHNFGTWSLRVMSRP